MRIVIIISIRNNRYHHLTITTTSHHRFIEIPPPKRFMNYSRVMMLANPTIGRYPLRFDNYKAYPPAIKQGLLENPSLTDDIRTKTSVQ